MKYKLTAVSDSDLSWNEAMEAWWNNGGALLWNLHGGMGADYLILTSEELGGFLAKAKHIDGWDSFASADRFSDKPVNPVTIHPHVEKHAPEPDTAPESSEGIPDICCRSCGRGVHPAIRSVWRRQMISVPRTELNHLLNSLQEAVEFSKGKGPNNHRTWESALHELIAFVESQEIGGSQPS